MAAAKKAPSKNPTADYGAKDTQVLEGLDPVRKRPGMYIGSTGLAGLHHLIWEVVDNSIDEAMAGFCTRVNITLTDDGGCRVEDNGRGIPVDPYPSGPHKGKSAAEVVLTVLHAQVKACKGWQDTSERSQDRNNGYFLARPHNLCVGRNRVCSAHCA